MARRDFVAVFSLVVEQRILMSTQFENESFEKGMKGKLTGRFQKVVFNFQFFAFKT